MPRASLLLACLPLAGCAGPVEAVASSGSLDDVPSFAEPRPEAPEWVRSQASAFWNDFGSIDAARGAPFARAALELELPAADCDDPPCRLRAHSYVRFERVGDALSLMPHCSVVAEDAELLHRASGHGPWRPASRAAARLLPDALPAWRPSRMAPPRLWPPSGRVAPAGAPSPVFQPGSGRLEPSPRPSILETRDPSAIVEGEGGEQGFGLAAARGPGGGAARGPGEGGERGFGLAAARGPGEGAGRGPGDLASLAEEPVELIGDGGARLRLRIERWWEPSAPPLAAWSAWLYARSLVRERARAFGIELGLFGGEDCEAHASLPQVHDVCWSSGGGPLSVLMDPTVPRYLDDSVPFYVPSEQEWVRQRVVSPVLAGHWQLFCGRLDGDQLRLSCDSVERRVRPFAEELVANGVDLTRFFAGATLVFGGRYYPQLSLDALATVARCLGQSEELTQELQRLAAEPELDFPNRFRIEYVRGRLAGREVGVAELRTWVPGPGADADDETRLAIDAADAACVEGLTGPMSLRSAG